MKVSIRDFLVGSTWLGLTVGCAQCHDHKYDPITQRDFYKVYAFFNNVPENGKDGVRDRNPKPFLRVTTFEQEEDLKRRDLEAAAAEKSLADFTKTLASKQAAWETQIVATGISAGPKGPVVMFPLDKDGDGSPDNRRREIEEKTRAYLEAGAREVIVVETSGRIRFVGADGERVDSGFGLQLTLPAGTYPL